MLLELAVRRGRKPGASRDLDQPTLVTPTWIAEDIDADGPGFMTAVSCVSTALCVAVDLNSRILISTDPADATPTWSAPAYIGELGLIETISCPSTSLCVAVDNYGRAVISTDPTAALPTWSVTDIDSVSPQPFTAHPYEVSCSSASLCVAVNNRGHAVISTDPAAVTPTWRAPATVDNTALTDIACPSTSLCVGIDEAGRAVISTDPTVPMPTWSAPTTVDNSALIGISCPTTSLCVALDKADRTVISTNPTSATPKWHVVTTPASVKPGREGFEELPQRISCASTSLCVITGSGTAMISTDLGSAAPTWSAPTDIDPRGAGATSLRGPPRVDGPTLRFELGCSATTTFGFVAQECPGEALLTSTERLAANGRVVTGIAAKTPRHRRVIVGRATFLTTAGKTTVTELILNGTGRRLLAKFKRLPAILRITANSTDVQAPSKMVTVKTVKVTFKAKPKARRKH